MRLNISSPELSTEMQAGLVIQDWSSSHHVLMWYIYRCFIHSVLYIFVNMINH